MARWLENSRLACRLHSKRCGTSTLFVNRTGLTYTGDLVECHSIFAPRSTGSEAASYPHRAMNFYAMSNAIYDGAELDATVEAYGSIVRDI